MVPLLSVVTVTYNHEKYISQALEGVLMQKESFPIGSIFADDCSSNGVLAICRDYDKQYPEVIRLITDEKNVSAVANKNLAFEAAKGKYIAT